MSRRRRNRKLLDLWAPEHLEFQIYDWIAERAPDARDETLAACRAVATQLVREMPPEIAVILDRYKREHPEGGEAVEVFLTAAGPLLLAAARKVIPNMRGWPVPLYPTKYRPPDGGA